MTIKPLGLRGFYQKTKAMFVVLFAPSIEVQTVATPLKRQVLK
jgi:hypothetical protein